MPPVFGPGVAVADALEVLRRRERRPRRRDRRRTRTSSESSGPVRPSSITSGAAGVAERRARQVGAHRVARVGERLGDEHALARGEAVGLHDVGAAAASRGTRAPRPRRRHRTRAWRAVGTPAAASTSFIHAFEPSSRAAVGAGPEREPAPGPRPRRPRRRRAAPRGRRRRGRRRARRRAARPRPDRRRRPDAARDARRSPGCRARRPPRSTLGERAAPTPARARARRAPTTRTSSRAIRRLEQRPHDASGRAPGPTDRRS